MIDLFDIFVFLIISSIPATILFIWLKDLFKDLKEAKETKKELYIEQKIEEVSSYLMGLGISYQVGNQNYQYIKNGTYVVAMMEITLNSFEDYTKFNHDRVNWPNHTSFGIQVRDYTPEKEKMYKLKSISEVYRNGNMSLNEYADYILDSPEGIYARRLIVEQYEEKNNKPQLKKY